jgi:hypothetical protein
MQTVSTKFESELKKRIDEELIRISEILSAGQAVKDYADYRYHVGMFHALNRVSYTFFDEVNTAINQR